MPYGYVTLKPKTITDITTPTVNDFKINDFYTLNNSNFDIGAIGPNMQLYEKGYALDEAPGSQGTTSMFNEYNMLVLSRIAGVDQPLQFSPKEMYDMPILEGASAWSKSVNYNFIHSQKDKYKAPTAGRIIEESTKGSRFGFGPMPYSWSDFLYCKYYGLIPNNQLITLRRYPQPITDNAQSNEPVEALLPVAQAVTWLGEETGNQLSNLLKFSFGVNWKEIEATVQEVEGNEVGFGAGIVAILGATAVGGLATAKNVLSKEGEWDEKRWNGLALTETEWRKTAWSSTGPYWNQVFGPVNVIHKSHMRERGMNFSHDITLKFHYSLKSINAVNPKLAMLDLITNFLSLTYTNAKFWGGMMRYFPNYKDPIAFFGDREAFYKGDYEKYVKGVLDAFKANITSIGDAGAKMVNSITDVDSALKVGKSAGMQLFERVAKLVLGKMARKSRPKMLSIRNLLSGDPVGEWHLTIGNPMNPIAVMGNLIIKDTSMEFGNILGADDFPTEVTFTVQLIHARPRDKGDIESMFNYGQGRITLSPLNKLPSQSNTNGENEDIKEDYVYVNNKDVKFTGSKQGIKGTVAEPEAYNEREIDAGDIGNSAIGDKELNNVRNRVAREWGVKYSESSHFESMMNRKKHVT